MRGGVLSLLPLPRAHDQRSAWPALSVPHPGHVGSSLPPLVCAALGSGAVDLERLLRNSRAELSTYDHFLG